jgi:DHA2 family multidrug resistance protein
MVTQQAWLLSFADVFMTLTVLFCFLVTLTLLIRKPSAAPPAGSGH